MLRFLLAAIVCASNGMDAVPGTVQPREGRKVFDTKLAFATLVEKLEVTMKSNKMGDHERSERF
jgi:hypothetical protein